MTEGTPRQRRFAHALGAFAVAALATACSPETVNAVTAGDARSVIHEMPDASRDRGPVANVPGYHTDGARIVDPSGNAFHIKAVSWYGLEKDFIPHGLYAQSLDTILQRIQTLGFNTLRMTWSSQMLDLESMPGDINANLNPDIAMLKTPLQILDAIVARAAKSNLKVILSRHQSSAAQQDELWYNNQYGAERFVTDWKTLASRYAGNATVIGCDLQSDLRGKATWGDGNPDTDWRAAAESAGNAILRANGAVLVFVQGVEKSSDGSYYWRGGNLKDADAHPIRLVIPDRLVYAPQDFPKTAQNPPPGMPPLSWFADSSYPANLPSVWRANWGYLLDDHPLLLAAFGTAYVDDSDRKWLGALAQYIQSNPGLSFAYWALNPESQDVKGLLMDDWSTTNPGLVNALQPILSP